MCAILGGNNPTWNYQAGIECMRHRGPDGVQVCALEMFTLAFARLSIMDLSENAMQPMFSEDGEVGLVFNGEIYGFQKLRKELQKKGYVFKSTSDTEVVLNAYLEWGEKFITRVDGMYGIAILDKRDRTVKLFRDRIGIKPLYYFYDGKNFAFASELKGIVTLCRDISFATDYTAVYDYLNYLYIPEPKTYYKNVYKLFPGHRLTFDIENRKIVKNSAYWRLNVNSCQGRQRKQEDIVEELRSLVKESVKRQMIADVPVGTFLSGGVDSSIITYESWRLNPKVETFTIGFEEKGFDESKYALQVAEKFNIHSNMRKFSRNYLYEYYRYLKDWYDEPFGDSSAFPTHFVSKLAKEKVTVVLTGDGGDEVFGGYRRYRMIQNEMVSQSKVECFNIWERKILCRVPFLDEKISSSIGKLYISAKPERDVHWRKLLGISNDYDKYWVIRRYYHMDLPPITRGQYLDIKTYLPGDILVKVDRAAMAVSLETRVPFLDRKIVEFAFSLSEEDRCPDGRLKGVLKRAYENELGKDFLDRKKQGFSVPFKYFDWRLTQQEELIKKVWGFKI